MRAASRDPDTILRWVEQEDADARREAVYGRSYRRGGREAEHVAAEICAQVDEEYGRPVRAVLREWCGAGQVEVRHELAALRREVARLTRSLDAALGALREAGAERVARRIESELRHEREQKSGAEPHEGRGVRTPATFSPTLDR